MMDVIQYVRADDTPRDVTSFYTIVHEFRRQFNQYPLEIRVSWPVLRAIIQDGMRVTSDADEIYRINGVVVRVLPELWGEGAVLLIYKMETLEVPSGAPRE